MVFILWEIKTDTLKKIWFKDSLNGNELINYIKWEIDRLEIIFYVCHRHYLFYY